MNNSDESDKSDQSDGSDDPDPLLPKHGGYLKLRGYWANGTYIRPFVEKNIGLFERFWPQNELM